MEQRAVVICGSLYAARNRITGAFGGVSSPVNWLPLRDNVRVDVLGLYGSVGRFFSPWNYRAICSLYIFLEHYLRGKNLTIGL